MNLTEAGATIPTEPTEFHRLWREVIRDNKCLIVIAAPAEPCVQFRGPPIVRARQGRRLGRRHAWSTSSVSESLGSVVFPSTMMALRRSRRGSCSAAPPQSTGLKQFVVAHVSMASGSTHSQDLEPHSTCCGDRVEPRSRPDNSPPICGSECSSISVGNVLISAGASETSATSMTPGATMAPVGHPSRSLHELQPSSTVAKLFAVVGLAAGDSRLLLDDRLAFRTSQCRHGRWPRGRQAHCHLQMRPPPGHFQVSGGRA